MFGIVGCQRSCAPANQTGPMGIGVLRSVLMPLGAMSGFGQRRRPTSATSHIFLSGDGFEVSRVDTTPCSTEMIKVKTVGNWPNEEFIGEPVSRRAMTRLWLELPIARAKRAEPQPTGAEGWGTVRDRAVFVDQVPETLNNRSPFPLEYAFWHREPPITGASSYSIHKGDKECHQ